MLETVRSNSGVVRLCLVVGLLLCSTRLSGCFRHGMRYSYDYETSTRVFAAKEQTNTSNDHTIRARLVIVARNQKLDENTNSVLLLKLNVEDVQSVGDATLMSSKTLQAVVNKPFVLEMSGDGELGVMSTRLNEATETTGSSMFKQSIAHLLNLNIKNNNTRETSLIGNCNILITTSADRNDQHQQELHVRKLKSDCRRNRPLASDEYRRREQMLNSQVERRVAIDYRLNVTSGGGGHLPVEVACVDEARVWLEFNRASYLQIQTTQTLKLVAATVEQIDAAGNDVDLSTFGKVVQEADAKQFLRMNEPALDMNVKRKMERGGFERKLHSLAAAKNTKEARRGVGTRLGCYAYLRLVQATRLYLGSNERLAQTLIGNALARRQTRQADSSLPVLQVLIQVLAAAQDAKTLDALALALGMDGGSVDYAHNDKHIDNLLVSLALASHISPSNAVSCVQRVRRMVERDGKKQQQLMLSDVHDKAMLALGSLVGLLSSTHSSLDRDAHLEAYARFIDDETSDSSNSSSRRTFCLASALNANMRDEQTFRLAVAEIAALNVESSSETASALMAIKALHAFPTRMFESKSKNNNNNVSSLLLDLWRRSNSVDSDGGPLLLPSEVRVELVSLILSKCVAGADRLPASMILEEMFVAWQQQRRQRKRTDKLVVDEYLHYCQRLLAHVVDAHPLVKDVVDQLFASRRLKLNPLDLLVAHGNGASNYLFFPLQEFENGRLTFALKQLVDDDGFVKMVDLALTFEDSVDEQASVDLLRFELYASNLGSLGKASFAKKSNAAKGNPFDQDPTASVHMSLLGQKLKIHQLFKGYTSLLGLVWKLPTKWTSLFAINFLLCDQREHVLMSNGMRVRVETTGAVSFDLSAITDISVWSMYARVNVRTNLALLVEQKLTLANVDGDVLGATQSDFDTHVTVDTAFNSEFKKSPAKTCLKISHNKFFLNEAVKKFKRSSAENGELQLTTVVYKRKPIQGSTYFFSRKASEFC